jgi:hypothetical protein
MADHPTLDAAPARRPGHFLPYLLLRRLRAVVWPADSGTRAAFLLILAVMLIYGAGFGFMLRGADGNEKLAEMMPKLTLGLYSLVLLSSLLVDFLPMLRPVARPLPEHFPVSARQNAIAAFLLDLITLRRLTLIAGLLMAVATAPAHAQVPGMGLLLLLTAAVLSYNVRLLVALRRWRHPFMVGHVACLALVGYWLAFPAAPYHTVLAGAIVALPLLLGTAQLYALGPYFSARFLPDAVQSASTAAGQLLARFSPEWKAYLRKARTPLLMGLAFKLILVSVAGFTMKDGAVSRTGFASVFYMAFLPAIGFTYVNNNLFGFLQNSVANEVQRLGLTVRVLRLYLRIVGPVVLIDALISLALLLAIFPVAQWHLAGLLPLGILSLSGIGLWGSLYQAKPVPKAIDFANMRKNASTLMSIATLATTAALYFMPWWWARIALAGLVATSAIWPIRAVLRNDGELRRRLWRGIGA